jgi:hypothetical protein
MDGAQFPHHPRDLGQGHGARSRALSEDSRVDPSRWATPRTLRRDQAPAAGSTPT